MKTKTLLPVLGLLLSGTASASTQSAWHDLIDTLTGINEPCPSGTCGNMFDSAEGPDRTGPGAGRTDMRDPELAGDPSIVNTSKVSMCSALEKTGQKFGSPIEAKFEVGDDGKLSLSIYPVGKGLSMDAERNVFEEVSGDPTVAPFQSKLEVFHDQEHLTRSSRDLTLRQLSRRSLKSAVCEAEEDGTVYWAIPTIENGRAGYGLYLLNEEGKTEYRFVDGEGSHKHGVFDLGDGPGKKATDARTPELGNDLNVLKQSKISMSDALKAAEAKYGPAIEAKYEIGDDGKLSLSIYPVGKGGTGVDAERNQFFELAGDPTADKFDPSISEFKVPDEEHLTRAARDLTLVQTAGMSLSDAVKTAEQTVPGGFVYWAIPTQRGTTAGYGIYTRDSNGATHYLFVNGDGTSSPAS